MGRRAIDDQEQDGDLVEDLTKDLPPHRRTDESFVPAVRNLVEKIVCGHLCCQSCTRNKSTQPSEPWAAPATSDVAILTASSALMSPTGGVHPGSLRPVYLIGTEAGS